MTLFTDTYLMKRPFASSNLSKGVYRKPVEEAFEDTWLETTPKTYRTAMTFDLDEDNASQIIKSMAWDDNTIPEPNWITVNPVSSHAHFTYLLDGGISTDKAISYYESVRMRFNALTGSDQAYVGRLTRNPLKHPTEYLTDRVYKLSDLDSYLPASLPTKIVSVNNEINGRNDFVFDSLRKNGYRFYVNSGFNANKLKQFLAAKARELNYSNFDGNLLEQRELDRIVKSVEGWIIRKFSKKAFSEIQKRRIRARWGESKNDIIAEMIAEGKTIREIAEATGKTYEAAKKAISRLKKAQG